MHFHPRDWIDRVPGWLVALLALCGLLTGAVGDHVFLALTLLALAGALAAYRYQEPLRNSDLWALEEWFTARRATLGIREWRSAYQAAGLYCTPAIVQARDDAAREMNAMMMELVRGEKSPAFATIGSGTGGPEPSRLTQQMRYQTAQVRLDQCNAALSRELTGQLASGELMAKGLLLNQGLAKSERIIATPRWRLLELNIAKSEASGPAGEYAGILIGKPAGKPPSERKPKANRPQPNAPREATAALPARAPTTTGERPAARGR